MTTFIYSTKGKGTLAQLTKHLSFKRAKKTMDPNKTFHNSVGQKIGGSISAHLYVVLYIMKSIYKLKKKFPCVGKE